MCRRSLSLADPSSPVLFLSSSLTHPPSLPLILHPPSIPTAPPFQPLFPSSPFPSFIHITLATCCFGLSTLKHKQLKQLNLFFFILLSLANNNTVLHSQNLMSNGTTTLVTLLSLCCSHLYIYTFLLLLFLCMTTERAENNDCAAVLRH